MPARLDIAMQRNEDFARAFTVTDDAGEPIDLTGYTIRLQIKDRLDNTTVIQSAVVTITGASEGMFDVVIDGGTGSALASYGDPLLSYELPYDLIATDDAGRATALIAGYLILSRGVTS